MLLRSLTWTHELEDSLKHWIALTVGSTSALLFGFNRGVWMWACVPEVRVLNECQYRKPLRCGASSMRKTCRP